MSSRLASVGAGLACILILLLATPSQGAKNVRVFNFRDTPLSEVLMLFTEGTKKNVVATPSIMDMPVTLYLENVTPMVALSVLCKNYDLWFTEDDGVIRVMKLEEYGRELMLRRDERTEVFVLNYASCFNVADVVIGVYGESVSFHVPKDMASYRHVGTDALPDEFGNLRGEGGGEAEEDADKLKRLTQEGVVQAGELSMQKEELGRLRQIVESGGGVSTQDLLEFQVGRAKAQLTVFPRSNALVVRSVDTRLLEDIRGLIDRLDTPTPQVLLECKILEVRLTDGFDSFFDFSLTPDATIDEATGAFSLPVEGAVASALGGIGLTESTFRFLYFSSQVQARLELMQREGRVRSISTPLVYAANNAAARFFQGDQVAVRHGYAVTDAIFDLDSGVQLVPAKVTTEYTMEDLGVELKISPSINTDGTVTMKIIVDIGALNIGAGPRFPYVVDGTQVVGETDTITKTRIEDIILAKDGQSLAIGGLIQSQEVRSHEKVPFLGDIPGLGFFFTSKEDSLERTEIIFVLTAHILEHPSEGGRLNEQLMPSISTHPWYVNGTRDVLDYNATVDELYDLNGRPVQEFIGGKSFKRIVREIQIGG